MTIEDRVMLAKIWNLYGSNGHIGRGHIVFLLDLVSIQEQELAAIDHDIRFLRKLLNKSAMVLVGMQKKINVLSGIPPKAV